jgi:microsomal epoxide hydrolase
MLIESLDPTVAQQTLDDLRERLTKTRWASMPPEPGWHYGTDISYLRDLLDYWRNGFDWRAQEAYIKSFPHYRSRIDGCGIHFIHVRGTGPNPIPLLLTHGYPDSFLRFLKIIPLLTAPENGQQSFDVVIPSIPGYGYSDRPTEPGMLFKIAGLWKSLMTDVLGYERFAAHGGDWGSTITEQLARTHGKSLLGIHITDVPFAHLFQKPDDPSKAEEKFFAHAEAWQRTEGAYAMIQSTRPSSLAVGLNDSPAGLAAWLVEKFRSWSDCGGDIERRFTRDELLTHITLYWVTQSIHSSFWLYYDAVNASKLTWLKEMMKSWVGSADVPTAFASFPKDLLPPPREWAERFFNVQRWTDMPRGGHFAALEEPVLLATDLREFFKGLR